MKKIIASFFLLICAVIVLLATVDLGPYLAPDKTTTSATGTTARQEPAAAAKNIEETGQPQQKQPDEPGDAPSRKPSLDEVYPEQEQVVIGPKTDTAVAEEEVTQTPPPSIELEVTTLPVGDFPFSILLATFQEKEAAQRAVSFYQKRGISAYWVKVALEEIGIRYRLFTGIFSTTAEARQYLERSGMVGMFIKPTYYAARVGVYTDKAELAGAFVKAGQAGVMPYILGTTKGDYYLYAGAFYTFVGATDQCRELTAAGLSCEPVKRSTVPPQ